MKNGFCTRHLFGRCGTVALLHTVAVCDASVCCVRLRRLLSHRGVVYWGGDGRACFPAPIHGLPLTTLDPAGYVDHHLLFTFYRFPSMAFRLRTAATSGHAFASLAVFPATARRSLSIAIRSVWLLTLRPAPRPFCAHEYGEGARCDYLHVWDLSLFGEIHLARAAVSFRRPQPFVHAGGGFYLSVVVFWRAPLYRALRHLRSSSRRCISEWS